SERRQVAVLFCDICGFTAMSESLDPEDVSNIIQPLFQLCNAAINKYGGVVEKFIGDAIMALFGVPYLHEDDPERAAMAALELRDIIQEYGAKLQKEQGFSVNMRIGLNVGTVVAGTVDATEGKNYQVMGDAINTAARMEQNAVPGNILVTEAMYRLINHSFELKPGKLITAKGKAEPLQAYDLIGIRRLQQRSRGMSERTIQMVDRQDELARLLKTALQSLAQPELACLLISGESGLGKTRLALELFNRLKQEYGDLQLLRGNATSYSQHFTYFVLQNMIRSCLGLDETIAHPQAVQRIQDFVNEIQIPNASMIASLLEYTLYPHIELPQLKFIAPDRLQKQIFKAVGDVLMTLAQRAPLLLLVDDLQWCDPLSLQWLQQFQESARQRQLPMLICVTVRPNNGGVGDENSLKWACHQSLQPLGEDHCNEMICHILDLNAHAGLPFNLGSLGEAILMRASGNPYYIEEVFTNLLQDGLLVQGAGGWELTCALKDLPLPSSIQRLIMSRFDRLDQEYRALLQTISALGNTASISLLEQLVNEVPGKLQQDLNTLVQSGFLRLTQTQRGQECMFLQALTQEVIYNTMVNRRKLALHQQIGDTLEKLHAADPYPVVDLLAYHFSRTKDIAKAVRYLHVAAEQAARLYANPLALEHYNYMLELMEQLEPQALIGTDLFQRDWTRASQLRQKAVRRRCEILLLTGAYDEVLSVVEKALKQTESSLEQARLMYCKGRVLEKRSEYAAAREVYEEARKLLEAQGELREQARLWNAIGWVCRWMGDYDQALQACQSALELLEEQPDMEQIAYAHNVLGVVYYYRHDWEQSLKHYSQSLDIQRQIHDLWGHANSLSNMGNVYFMTNRWEEAVDVFKQSLELREQLGDTEGVSTSCNNLGHAMQELGEYEQAERYLRRALELYQQMGHRLGEATAHCNLGSAAFRQKQWDKALELIESGIASMEALQLKALLAEIYNHRIEIQLELNNLNAAARYLESDTPAIMEHGEPVQKGRLERLWGRYSMRSQDAEAAQTHLQLALELLQPTGHRGECLILYRDLADLHRHRGSDEAHYWEEACLNLQAEEQQV
ncbi:MAG: tetratricopeptide repeat protein, partial [Candidatus Sericytochromatia bacterium]